MEDILYNYSSRPGILFLSLFLFAKGKNVKRHQGQDLAQLWPWPMFDYSPGPDFFKAIEFIARQIVSTIEVICIVTSHLTIATTIDLKLALCEMGPWLSMQLCLFISMRPKLL